MKLNKLIYAIYLLYSFMVFVFFKADLGIWTSFFINFLVITALAYYHLNVEKFFSPILTTYIIFNYLFFIVAPCMQISKMIDGQGSFPNALIYDDNLVYYANFCILLFNLFFSFFYLKLSSKQKINSKDKIINRISKNRPVILFIFLIICLFIVAINFNTIIIDYNQSVYVDMQESLMTLLIRKKVIFLFPLGAVALIINYLKSKKKITTNFIIISLSLFLILIILLFLKNPLTEKRNALGPLYITLIYMFFPKLIDSNSKFFLFMFLSMVIAFPLISAVTHIDASLGEMLSNPNVLIESYLIFGEISSSFTSLNYDAYSNFLASIELTESFGFTYGYGIIGVLLFFVPRSIWTTKPISSGQIIGDYVIENYGFGNGFFNNLSNPFISEGYLNFGIIGVIIFPCLFVFFIAEMIKWFNSKDILKQITSFYFAVHLIFLLRGDLLNGVAFFVGPFIGFFILPKLIVALFKKW